MEVYKLQQKLVKVCTEVGSLHGSWFTSVEDGVNFHFHGSEFDFVEVNVTSTEQNTPIEVSGRVSLFAWKLVEASIEVFNEVGAIFHGSRWNLPWKRTQKTNSGGDRRHMYPAAAAAHPTKQAQIAYQRKFAYYFRFITQMTRGSPSWISKLAVCALSGRALVCTSIRRYNGSMLWTCLLYTSPSPRD